MRACHRRARRRIPRSHGLDPIRPRNTETRELCAKNEQLHCTMMKQASNNYRLQQPTFEAQAAALQDALRCCTELRSKNTNPRRIISESRSNNTNPRCKIPELRSENMRPQCKVSKPCSTEQTRVARSYLDGQRTQLCTPRLRINKSAVVRIDENPTGT